MKVEEGVLCMLLPPAVEAGTCVKVTGYLGRKRYIPHKGREVVWDNMWYISEPITWSAAGKVYLNNYAPESILLPIGDPSESIIEEKELCKS